MAWVMTRVRMRGSRWIITGYNSSDSSDGSYRANNAQRLILKGRT